ncbi:hypothetical protein [Sphingomonas gellani]|nr:hypothetical protein [Sphingomonas gellani]
MQALIAAVSGIRAKMMGITVFMAGLSETDTYLHLPQCALLGKVALR